MRATARLQMPALHIRRVHTEQADTAVREATEAAAADWGPRRYLLFHSSTGDNLFVFETGFLPVAPAIVELIL